MPSLIPEPLTSILPHTLPHPHPQPQPHLDTMCHSTVFWYLCNHLVFNETKCPFEGTLPSHSKDFTTAAFTDHPCCLCQQPASPAVEALREGQLTPSRLQPVFGIDVNDTRFPWCVAEFFARGEHLRYKQPDPRFRRDSGAGAGAASASASRTSSFSSGSSGRGTCAPSVSKAKQSPTIKVRLPSILGESKLIVCYRTKNLPLCLVPSNRPLRPPRTTTLQNNLLLR